MPPKPGRVIARRYHLEESIGHGAMGIVWRAHDRRLHRMVAIKEVLLGAAIDEHEMANRYQRTQREAETAAALSHRNIVTVHDVIMDHGRPWIVMELVPSPSLDRIVTSLGSLTALRAARIGQQLLAALSAAHAAGVLHRDVKPSNVLIAPDRSGDGWGERAVLTDFGIAQFEGDPRLTQTGETIGTLGFMAPERIDGYDATPASDLWSLGATIYAAVEGHGPFDRDTTMRTMSAIMSSDSPPRSSSAGRLAPLLEGLLRREPADRLPASAAARMFTEILPLMAAEAEAQRREDTEPSGFPVPPPLEPLGAPTQSFPPRPQSARPQQGPQAAASMSASDPAEHADDLLRQLDWEAGGSRRSARRVRSRSSARRVRTIGVAASTSILVIVAIGFAVFMLNQHKASPGNRLSSSTPASNSISPTASPASLPPVSSAAAVAMAIDKISSALPPNYKTQLLAASAAGATAGFSLDIPQDWTMNSMGQQTYQYTPQGSADGVTYVEIDLTADRKSNMVAEAMLLAGQHHATFPNGYQPISGKKKNYVQLEPIRGTAGALWQFDYVGNGVTMRMDVLLFTLDKQSYTIYMTAPAGRDDSDWDNQALPIVEEILHTFEPFPG